MKKFSLKTWQAFLITVGLLTVGYIFSAFAPDSPYGTFASTMLAVFTGYTAKRLIQKGEKFNSEVQNDKG